MNLPPLVLRWPERSNTRAIANAREAAVVASRRRVERAEVEAFLATCAALPAGRRDGLGGEPWVRTDVRVAEPGR